MNKMKKVVILQSNYIPWKGYFDLIKSADEFIFYDEVQYTKNDWRNRNQVKSPNGLHWLTIPVKQNSIHQIISETKVVDDKWKKKHFETLRQFYSKALNFKSEIDFIESLYNTCNYEELSKINYHFISNIAERLGIKTKLSWSHDYETPGGKTARLVHLVKAVGGTHYISGLAAKSYLDTSLFAEAGIELLWANYSGYQEYHQVHPPFAHGVSIIDLLLNTGYEASSLLKNEIY